MGNGNTDYRHTLAMVGQNLIETIDSLVSEPGAHPVGMPVTVTIPVTEIPVTKMPRVFPAQDRTPPLRCIRGNRALYASIGPFFH